MKGTVISAAGGAALGALAVVGVYEGKVRVSHASEHVDVAAGDRAKLDEHGATKLATKAERDDADAALKDESGDLAYAEANRSLVENVQALNRRLGAIEDEKKRLQKKLEDAEVALARSKADGGVVVAKSDFDLSKDEWAELAKDGTVKFEVPCVGDKGPPADVLGEKGFPPDDGPLVRDVTKRSNDRVWSVLRGLCAQAIGSAEVADRIGAPTCVHLVLDLEQAKDHAAAAEAMRQVGEIRAGVRPEPGPNDAIDPVLRLFLTMTAERSNVEAELSTKLGPDEAKRLLDSGAMCMSRSTFGGPGPRK